MKRFSIASLSSSTPALVTISREGDVVKRGCLYVKRPPSDSAFKLRLKTWQKRYLVLRDSWTADNDSSLELYTCVDSCKCHAVSLRQVMLVDVYRDSMSFPHAFIVFRAGKSPLIFGAKTDREMREWMMAIKLLSEKLTSDRHITTPVSAPATGTEQGVATGRMSQRPQQHLLHASRRDDLTRRSSPQLLTVNSSSWSTEESYPVSVEAHNDHGIRFSQHEHYMLTVNDDCLTLRPTHGTSDTQDGGGDVIVRWPITDIRKLKCESMSNGKADLITLVSARGGSRQLVTYTFRTEFGLAIIRCVRQVDSQSSSAPQSTQYNVHGSTRRPAARLADYKLNSSFDSSADDVKRGKIDRHSGSQPDLLSATEKNNIQSSGSDAQLSNSVSTTLASSSSRFQHTTTANNTRAAFYLQLTSDDNVTDVSFNRHLITSKSLSDVTDNISVEQQNLPPPRPPPRPLHTMSNVNI